MANVEKYFELVDQNQKKFIEALREVVAIPSVSGDAARRPDVIRMGEWLQAKWEALGATCKRVDPGKQDLHGAILDLPPVILGQYGNDPSKKTVLVYGHYDVQPALLDDGWETDPFTLVEKEDGRLVGRGSTDDKGPVLGWLLCAQTHKEAGIDFPVNLKFCFEGMEESGSEGLDDIIVEEADKWFKGTDVVCISDNYWLGKNKPCLTHGLRGVSYFHLLVEGPGADLHSGVFGGTVHEPMVDLVHLMSKLVDVNGRILVPGIYDQVMPVTEEEEETYQGLEFSHADLAKDLKNDVIIHGAERDTLKHRWRYPTLSIHGVEGAFYASGDKTVIPAKVRGKFSLRTVPNMEPAKVAELVTEHLNAEFAKLGSKNKMTVIETHGGRWWYSSPKHPNFIAGAKATEKVYGVKPDLTREGGSIPVTLTFEENLNVNVLLLPMGAADDGAHSINEKLDKRNYIQGIKLLGAYLHEVAQTDLAA
ncbi:CNDP dipeptidase [Martensiomyces pterosporus]|nr:CNDP dipeptidase [Martensiomyces pterosporus]